MNCKKCNNPLSNDAVVCPLCGEPVNKPAIQSAQDLPEQYRPLSAWAYFGLQILFSLPIIGFIFLIVFSFNGSNINRRSFARSYWCAYLILGIILLVVVIFAAIFGASAGMYY